MPNVQEEVMDLILDKYTGLGIATDRNRDSDNAIMEGQCPIVSASWGGSLVEKPDSCSTTRHRATVIVDHWATTVAGALDMLNRAAGAFEIDHDLGGRLQLIQVTNVGGDEAFGADIGSIPMTLEVLFYTQRGDWSALAF